MNTFLPLVKLFFVAECSSTARTRALLKSRTSLIASLTFRTLLLVTGWRGLGFKRTGNTWWTGKI